jgi:hypothetical protein
VKFQIQEDSFTGCDQFAYELWTFGGEQLAAYFEHPDRSAQSLHESQGGISVGDIQRND